MAAHGVVLQGALDQALALPGLKRSMIAPLHHSWMDRKDLNG